MKKQNSMKKPVSIKWKIFASLVFFIAIVIVVLWLFQVFFLENFYMSIKSNAVKKLPAKLMKSLHQIRIQINPDNRKRNDFVLKYMKITKMKLVN